MSLAALNNAAVHAATIFLAQPEGADPGGKGEGFGKSTPVGLLLMIALLIAVALLVRSMTKHLKRVPKSFDPEQQGDSDAAETGNEDSEDDGTAESGREEAADNAAEQVAAREKS